MTTFVTYSGTDQQAGLLYASTDVPGPPQLNCPVCQGRHYERAGIENCAADHETDPPGGFDAEPETRAIFRKFRNGDHEIVALFPDLPGSNDPAMCLSYMHTGQHGAANLLGMMYSWSRPASPDEYADLKRELELPPYEYRLKVIRRTPKDSAGIRTAKIRRITS